MEEQSKCEWKSLYNTNGNEWNECQTVSGDWFTLACAVATVANFCCPDLATTQLPGWPDCWPNWRAWCPAIWDRWNFVGADRVCAAVVLRFHQSHRLRRWHRCRSPWIRRNFAAMLRSHPPAHKSLSFGILWCTFGGNTSSTLGTEHHPLAKFFGHKNHIGSSAGNACARNRVVVKYSPQICRQHPIVQYSKTVYRKWR